MNSLQLWEYRRWKLVTKREWALYGGTWDLLSYTYGALVPSVFRSYPEYELPFRKTPTTEINYAGFVGVTVRDPVVI